MPSFWNAKVYFCDRQRNNNWLIPAYIHTKYNRNTELVRLLVHETGMPCLLSHTILLPFATVKYIVNFVKLFKQWCYIPMLANVELGLLHHLLGFGPYICTGPLTSTNLRPLFTSLLQAGLSSAVIINIVKFQLDNLFRH